MEVAVFEMDGNWMAGVMKVFAGGGGRSGCV